MPAPPPISAHRPVAAAQSRRLRAVYVHRRPNTPRGFSLLELIIVLAITGALSTIGVIRYAGSLARYRVDAAGARLIADLRSAQTEARTSGSIRHVRFSPGIAAYGTFNGPELAANTPRARVQLSQEPYRCTMTVSGLVGNIVAFDGRGECNGGGYVVLTSGDRSVAVFLEPGTGRAYVAGSNN